MLEQVERNIYHRNSFENLKGLIVEAEPTELVSTEKRLIIGSSLGLHVRQFIA